MHYLLLLCLMRLLRQSELIVVALAAFLMGLLSCFHALVVVASASPPFH